MTTLLRNETACNPTDTDTDTDPDLDTPYEPSPAEWAAYCNSTRDESPDPPSERAADLPAAHWFACQVNLMRDLSRESDDLYDLIGCAMNDLHIALTRTGARTVRGLIASGVLPYALIDLDAVKVPTERHTHLADILDEQAQYYLDLGTDLGRLAAWSVLQHAEGCEYFGSETLEDYLDSDAAFHEAVLTLYDDCNPLW